MSGFYETIALDDTTIFKWTRQDYRPYTELIAGDIVLADWDIHGVEITGNYQLATEADTLARLTQLAELVENQEDTFAFWGQIWRKSAFVRHSVVGTYWVHPDPHPTIKIFGGENKAYVSFFMKFIGNTTTHVACYLINGVEILTNDWSI